KWPVQKNYKFCFCYENMGEQEGYITEKIFDSFTAGCVPIYLGATNITSYIPKECFIDRRDFASESDLYDFLKSIDRGTYNGYLKAIRSFLESQPAQSFSIEQFVNYVLGGIAELENQPS